MPLKKEDKKHWRLFVPEENCEPGLEVGINATSTGLQIGDGEIPWADLENARHQAGGTTT